MGTSALREATDGKSFLRGRGKWGCRWRFSLKRMISRWSVSGIMSGLRFHLPLGLFLDIGGGSVEMTVANAANIFCLFSLPLGAVRLTEEFLPTDPPRNKEIHGLRRVIQDKLTCGRPY